MKMRGRLNRTLSVTEPNSVETALSNTLPNSKNCARNANTYGKDVISGNLRMFQHDNLQQETYFHDLSGDDIINKSHKTGIAEEVSSTPTTGANDGPSSKLGSIAMSSSTLPMSLSSMQQNVRTLPLPKLGLSSPWFNAGKIFSLIPAQFQKLALCFCQRISTK